LNGTPTANAAEMRRRAREAFFSRPFSPVVTSDDRPEPSPNEERRRASIQRHFATALQSKSQISSHSTMVVESRKVGFSREVCDRIRVAFEHVATIFRRLPASCSTLTAPQVDSLSIFIFPCLFLLFNVAYWIFYITRMRFP